MYQYSLSYFTRLFNHCLEASEASADLPTRLHNLLAFTTEFMYRTVCRGLFEAHRLLFSFLICTAIKRDCDQISLPAWEFLLRGPPVAAAGDRTAAPASRQLPSALTSWVTPVAWSTLQSLERVVPELTGLILSISDKVRLCSSHRPSIESEFSFDNCCVSMPYEG